MIPEELLKPRYKVIADYPNSPYTIGDVYVFKKKLRNSFYEKANGFSSTNLYSPEKYPHLFKKLEWWDERKESDMPEYVKVITEKSSLFRGDVHKVKAWSMDYLPCPSCRVKEEKSFPYDYLASHFEPATEEEYTDYLTSRK